MVSKDSIVPSSHIFPSAVPISGMLQGIPFHVRWSHLVSNPSLVPSKNPRWFEQRQFMNMCSIISWSLLHRQQMPEPNQPCFFFKVILDHDKFPSYHLQRDLHISSRKWWASPEDIENLITGSDTVHTTLGSLQPLDGWSNFTAYAASC